MKVIIILYCKGEKILQFLKQLSDLWNYKEFNSIFWDVVKVVIRGKLI